MKRRLTLFLAILLLLLPALAGCHRRTVTDEDGLLVYPGTAWNATPEEVQKALHLKSEDCMVSTPTDESGLYCFTVQDVSLYGQKADVTFAFSKAAGNTYGLYLVLAAFDGVSADVLEDTLEKSLSAPSTRRIPGGSPYSQWQCPCKPDDYYTAHFPDVPKNYPEQYDRFISDQAGIPLSQITLYETGHTSMYIHLLPDSASHMDSTLLEFSGWVTGGIQVMTSGIANYGDIA